MSRKLGLPGSYIHILSIVCDGAEEGIFVRGLPEMNIRDIYLENMVLKLAKGAEPAEAQQMLGPPGERHRWL